MASVADAEPVAERRPVPVFLIALLVLLVYLGDMYVMENGADVFRQRRHQLAAQLRRPA